MMGDLCPGVGVAPSGKFFTRKRDVWPKDRKPTFGSLMRGDAGGGGGGGANATLRRLSDGMNVDGEEVAKGEEGFGCCCYYIY